MTGGIAAGKTETLRAFARRGAAVISSDDIVHRLLREDEEVRRSILDRWGAGVVGDDGQIDRSRVADIVFSDRDELLWLEALLHPRVEQVYLDWREELAGSPDPPAVIVTEVPLLYEAGGDERFDAVVAITASPEVRAGRRMGPFVDREQRLLPDREKLERADFAYVNDGSLDDLERFVSDVMAKLTA